MPWALCLSTVGATVGMWNKDHLLLQGQHVYRAGMERDQDSAHPGLSSPWLSIAVLALPLPPLVCQSAHSLCHCYQFCLLPECLPTCFLLLRGRNKSPWLVPKTPPSAFPSVAHLIFLPTLCALCGTCHPVLLLATREHVPVPQIVHSFCSSHFVSLGRTLPAHL